MTATYQELLAQLKQLETQAEDARKRESKAAIDQAREIIQRFGLTQEDVFPTSRKKSSDGSTHKVAPKYRDPVSGATWTGRGKAPKWIEGKDKAQFAI